MKRIFLVVGHEVRTDGRFSLNDLSGSTGRLDILLRAINSAFLLSNGIRKNVELFLVLQGEPVPPVTIRLEGRSLKYLNPDERSTGALIRQALLTERKEGKEVKATPGIYVSDKGYKDVLRELMRERMPVYLHEGGTAIRETDIPKKSFFVLGDKYDLTPKEIGLLGDTLLRVSLGPLPLHTDHCITILNSELDLRGW